MIHLRHLRSLSLLVFTCWASHSTAQKQARQHAKRAQHGLRQFKLHRALLGWQRCSQKAKLEQVHKQLAASNSLHGHLKQQSRDAEKALADLQEERAGLHRRLERVADHAKLQVQATYSRSFCNGWHGMYSAV